MKKDKEISEKELMECLIYERQQINIHISNIFYQQYKPNSFSPHFQRTSLSYFIRELDVNDIEEALEIAINKIPDKAEDALKYFCGICWNKIKYPEALNIVKIDVNNMENLK